MSQIPSLPELLYQVLSLAFGRYVIDVDQVVSDLPSLDTSHLYQFVQGSFQQSPEVREPGYSAAA